MADSNDQPAFTPGLALAEQFYHQVVWPILDRQYPGLPHAAALIGSGSEVLGYDDIMSTDHHWGPRVQLFLAEVDHVRYAAAIRETLANLLPTTFGGYPTNFSEPIEEEGVTQLLRPVEQGPINHRVEVHTIRGFFRETLNIDLDQPLVSIDWLTFPEQGLRSVTAGAVFHDTVGLEDARRRFAAYPHDVWLYLMAAGWARIGQEEHLMGRAGYAGDEIGSAVIGARLVRDIMRLCFLMERVYAPYPKWFGTAFHELACAADLEPCLQGALHAGTWQQREGYLVQAYEQIAHIHNNLTVTDPLPVGAMQFHGRPFRVIAERGFAAALLARIEEPALKALAKRPLIGGVDHFSDSTDLLSYPEWRPVIRMFYSPPGEAHNG